MINNQQLRNKFLGCLLGAAIGDAVGESWDVSGSSLLRYTDDTHMTIGVAESLIECKDFDGAHMATCFVKNYAKEPWRGYGPGPPRVFELLERGESWSMAASQNYPGGGSFGNGAAMRTAPLGLFFWNNFVELKKATHLASIITHSHFLGIEGAILQASAVALAVAENTASPFDQTLFISRLLNLVTEDIYRSKISILPTLLNRQKDRQSVLQHLGHSVEAFNSVPTAIFCFLADPQSFLSAISCAISLEGDTDTIASMAGAISGAYLGIDAIPSDLQNRLENRDYIYSLADKLWQITPSVAG